MVKAGDTTVNNGQETEEGQGSVPVPGQIFGLTEEQPNEPKCTLRPGLWKCFVHHQLILPVSIPLSTVRALHRAAGDGGEAVPRAVHHGNVAKSRGTPSPPRLSESTPECKQMINLVCLTLA